MEEEDIEKKSAKTDSKTKLRVLIAVLIMLSIIIVGLVIWIVFNSINNNGQKEVACEEMTDEHEMMTCLSHEEPGESLNNRYDTTLQKSFDEEDYELFNELISDRTTDLILEEDCETPLSWLESIESKYVSSLPILKQYGFYVSGMEVASECGDSEKEEYYQGKMYAIMTSKEYADAVVGDDYRIIGENDGDEYIEDDGDKYEE